MSLLPASAAEPRHTRGGAGGAGRGQHVPYPLRVVLDADAYAPFDTNVYGKWRALASGRRATASVEKVAGWLGVSKSTLERSVRRLGRPAPTDGVVELFTKRQTHKVSGTGQTAERWCRELGKGEAYVWGPVRAADSLSGNEHRLYLGLRYTVVVKGHQPTLAELAELLRHHGGRHAGKPLAEASVARLLDRLAALGWITLDKRAGYRGRHLITVHDDPVRPVDGPDTTADPGDGSGPDLADGSLAYKEDLELTDLRTTQVGGSFRRRRGNGEWVAAPVDNSPVTIPETFHARTPVRPAERPAYDGPALTLSGRVWAVLAPVADLLPAVSPFMVRRTAREIGRQLDAGILPEDIRDQLTRLRAWTPPETITDPGRWLYGAALPARPGRCGRPGCHYGFEPHTGRPCKACADAPVGGTRPAQTGVSHPQTPAHRLPDPEPHAPPAHPPDTPPHAPTGRVGAPPGTGGWRSLVARERPQAAADAYRHRWHGDHAHHLDTA
ncbi:hypothetical protein [Streptomyces antibioticus]|uniref:hypothetical protein n=1 Tax=Streptomyces antibioticus TaxID=1890 RepID=UPI003D761D66